MFYESRLRKEKSFDRLRVLTILIFVLAGLIVLKLIKIQIFDHNYYVAQAKDQQEFISELQPNRGEILIQDLKEGKNYPIATNRKFYLLYAIPVQVTKPKEASQTVSQLFGADENKIYQQLTKVNDTYEILVHKVDDLEKAEVEKQKFDGLKFMDENWRFYPENNLASQVLGFVGYQGEEKVGRYGLEGYFQKELAGLKGLNNFTKDAVGRLIPVAGSDYQPAEDGVNLVLTLDRSIQYVTCTNLAKAVQKHGADEGSAIVMNPKTGAILAMCDYPDFDPNNYGQVENIDFYNNSAIFSPYEPGSTFKSITMSMAIDLGRVVPETTYEDKGEIKISGFTIYNSDKKAHGIKTMTNVLEDSLNTGAIFAAQKVGNDLFKKYVSSYGFGKTTGITLDTEAAGNISALGKGDVYTATGSFGQGLTVTPLQIITAYSAFANGGKLMKPYIVAEKQYPDGRIEKTEPQVVRQVISSKTALTISGMLASVVQNGHSKGAKIDGYYVAGKTGTAQVADSKTGEYYAVNTIHSFIAFAPLDDPQFVVLTKLNHPRDAPFAESTAVPLFHEIGQFLVNYLHIPREIN